MKALLFAQYGDPNVLTVGDVPEPHAGPGEIRIAVRAAGVSPGDDAIRSGAWRDRVPLALPYVVGLDAAGVVDEVGDGVHGVRVGDEVFGLRFRGNTTAEYAVLDAWAHKPGNMRWPQAGGAATGIETAVRALDVLGVHSGTTLLLDGAGGGVGAVARGARVIGTASTPNHPFLEELGAIPIEYGPGLPERIQRVTGHPVDSAVDIAGRGSVEELVRITGDANAVLTLVNPAAENQGVRLLRFDPAADNSAALEYGAELVAAGRLAVHVAHAYPMDEGPAAHTRVASRHTRGKIVITVP
ncbi:oxidoreductase [Planotetraspora thailandica]|uniref:Oxidoreductase n=1 Tax=Planotetraspora thailandica TaxID=487172 RepID=A0A8J3Y1F2_9ACTN|nr:NADP-dependent oxidoreductase [Planotetraspora thailandica]GII59034.1 oxidoreductase [Planotetraspora thailandica]